MCSSCTPRWGWLGSGALMSGISLEVWESFCTLKAAVLGAASPSWGRKSSWDLRKMLTDHQLHIYYMLSRNKYHSIVLFPVQHFTNLWVSRKNSSSSQVTMLLEIACGVWQVGLPFDPEVCFMYYIAWYGPKDQLVLSLLARDGFLGMSELCC